MGAPTRGRLRLGLVLALVALPACARALDQAAVERAHLAARVTTALVNDPDIGTRPITARVEAPGVVRLTGRVATEAEAARAEAVAGAVSGVTRVVRDLSIRPEPDASPPPRTRGFAGSPEAEFAELERTYDHFAAGASVGWSRPGDDRLDSRAFGGPLVRLGSGEGLGPAIAFDWFRTTVQASPSGDAASDVSVRPLMAGLGYTLSRGRFSVSPSLVAGYSFNGLTVPTDGRAGRLAVGVDNGFVWRPGVSVWIDTSRRTAVNVSLGRVMTALDLTFVEGGRLSARTVDADTTVVHVGLVYKLF
ncbi:MAG: BON domain-containing protein [Vicinamibacterales bacterium]